MSRRFILAVIVGASLLALQSVHAQWQASPGKIPLLTMPEVPSTEPSTPGNLHIERVDHENIGDAFKYFWHQKTFGLGYIPKDAVKKAMGQRDVMRAALGAGQGKGMSAQLAQPQWNFVGPSNIGGRVNALAIDPTNENVIYAGAAEGGVWKTTDAGTTWNPLTDQMQAVSMGALAIDPQHPDTVYAGTGEFSNGESTYTGDGLLRSTNGGSTWSDVGPANISAYSRVIVNPKHSNLVYAAAGRAGGGVLRSTDAGITWQLLAGGLPQNAGVSDLALSMNGDIAVLYAGVVSNGVYSSTDGGDTWNKIDFSGSPLGNLTGADFVRISLDVDPANWQNVVVLDVNSDAGAGGDDFGGLVESNDGGASWTDIGGQFEGSSSPFAEGGGTPPQGWYDVYIRVDPSDFSHMLFGGVTLAGTRDGGQSWSIHNGNEIHPDHHAAAFAPSDPKKVYIGCDGGVFYSPDGGDQFNSETFPLPITQFYGIGIDQTQDDVTYGGTQDNGSMTGATGLNWNQFEGGDGTYTLVDPKTSSYIYWEYPQSIPQVYGNARATQSGFTAADSTVWLDPFAADVNNDIVYWGCSRLVYTINQGASWHNCAQSFGSASGGTTISAIDAFGDGKTVLVGTGGGLVYVTANNGVSFTNISKGLPGRVVTCVRFDPSTKTTFYATMSGFGAGHVFKTTNNGTNWTDISSTLPDIPVNSIVMDPQNPSVLYIGTDVGVFLSPNDGGEWIPYGTGLPNTSVVYMEIQKKNRILRVGTQGRSIWEVPLEDDVTGIVTPVQQTVWTIGDTAQVQWHGFNPPVAADISLDGGSTWQNLATGLSTTSYSIGNVAYNATANALVRVSDAVDTVVSPLFRIGQQKLGDQVATIAELPMYLYDIAYDKDDNVLWATTLDNSGNIYKIDPDKGTLLDSVKLAVQDQSVMAGLTGIKYDPHTKHLFLQQVNNTSNAYAWNSLIYEVQTDGTIVNEIASPAEYGTGIYVKGDTILVADRMASTIQMATMETWASPGAFNNLNPLNFSDTHPVSSTGPYIYGPRGLTYDSKLGEYLLGFTDFTGPNLQSTSFNGSELLFLDTISGAEQSSVTILDGEQTANIRGMEYDPRGNGNTAWITILTGANSAKLVKIALADGPTGAPVAALTAQPSPIAFGGVDTGKSNMIPVEIHNSGNASGTINAVTIIQAASDYSMGAVATPVTLKPGDSFEVDITFAPHIWGEKAATLQLTMSDGATASFPISGYATINGAGVSENLNPADWLLEISPNPANTVADLTINAVSSDIATVHIYDVTGREISSVPLGTLSAGEQEMELSTAGLPNGMYFVRVMGARGEMCSAKLVIAR